MCVHGNGLRAGHEELKKALGTTDAAVLKLRKASYKVDENKESNEPFVDAQKGRMSTGSGFFLFACCASREVPKQ